MGNVILKNLIKSYDGKKNTINGINLEIEDKVMVDNLQKLLDVYCVGGTSNNNIEKELIKVNNLSSIITLLPAYSSSSSEADIISIIS